MSFSVMTNSTAAAVYISFKFFVDGQPVGILMAFNNAINAYTALSSGDFIHPVAAGTHKVDLYWASDSTAYGAGALRKLTVREL